MFSIEYLIYIINCSYTFILYSRGKTTVSFVYFYIDYYHVMGIGYHEIGSTQNLPVEVVNGHNNLHKWLYVWLYIYINIL